MIPVISLGFCLLVSGCQNRNDSVMVSPDPLKTPASVSTPSHTEAPSSTTASDLKPAVSLGPAVTLTPEPTSEASTAGVSYNGSSRYPDVMIPLSQVDFASYRDELGEEDWQALSAFFPVLLEEKTFAADFLPSSPAPLPEVWSLNTLFAFWNEDIGYPGNEFALSSFTLCDMNGDGQKELALYSDLGALGPNCVLFRDGDAFYGVYTHIRQFIDLQENGIFVQNSGAASDTYCRMYFEEGAIWEETLAITDWGYYSVDGKEASEEEFNAWADEMLVGEPCWHVARPIQ